MKVFIVAALLAVAAAQSYHAPAPAYRQPTYAPAPAYHQPTYAPAPAYHQPTYAPAPAYRQPTYAPAPAYHQPSQGHQQSYDAPPKYDYSYDVHGYGDYEPQFNAQEARDGYSTQGSYSVVLPDGRTQTVTYNTADAYSGNVAEVTYSGEAQYPSYQPAPAYKPAHRPSYPVRSYQPAPAYGKYQ